MTAILIISAFLLALASFSIVRAKRATSQDQPADNLPPARPSSLFGADPDLETDVEAAREEGRARLATSLLERAASGDFATLTEAHGARIAGLESKVLDALVADAASDSSGKRLFRLVEAISASDELRGNISLAEAVRALWRKSPDRALTSTLLRAAALSDSASCFEETIEEVFRAWHNGALRGLTGRDLRALAESEYWLLGAEARRSGAGFMLKEKLAALRRSVPESKQVEPS